MASGPPIDVVTLTSVAITNAVGLVPELVLTNESNCGATSASTPPVVVMLPGVPFPVENILPVAFGAPLNRTLLPVRKSLSSVMFSVEATNEPTLKLAPGPTMIPFGLISHTARLLGAFILPTSCDTSVVVTRLRTAALPSVRLRKFTCASEAMSKLFQLTIDFADRTEMLRFLLLPLIAAAGSGTNGSAPLAKTTLPLTTVGLSGVLLSCAKAGAAHTPRLAPRAVESARRRRREAAAALVRVMVILPENKGQRARAS